VQKKIKLSFFLQYSPFLVNKCIQKFIKRGKKRAKSKKERAKDNKTTCKIFIYKLKSTPQHPLKTVVFAATDFCAAAGLFWGIESILQKKWSA